VTDFLQLRDRTVLIAGVANKRSVATHIARTLIEAGATVLYCVQTEAQEAAVRKLFGADAIIFRCDVEDAAQIEALGDAVQPHAPLAGFVHSIAFANYTGTASGKGPEDLSGFPPFHEVRRDDFLQAVNISCYSFIAMARVLAPHLAEDASLLTVGISTTDLAAENYGYMAPVKAALHSSVVFLAKSLAETGPGSDPATGATSRVRVNSVNPGLLKTSASAGIPGYLDSYLFAEKATIRHAALQTEEVANVAAFLLSPRSSGLNAQSIVIDAGMHHNFFDKRLVDPVVRPPKPQG